MSETANDPRLNAYAHTLIANARLSSHIETELAAAGGIGIDVYDVLVTLEDAPEGRLRLSDLADRIVMSRSGLTRRLDRL
ncbi:MAG TPA: hypothetical protein VNI20_03945, partial [Fimbriimonadaceae bacterium]|nr:hypothetical protein [Fimbriimonadaceae bacterium]